MDKRLINEEIKEKKLLVIDDNGEKLGEKSLADALALANEKEMDLVLLVPSSENRLAVAKIADYGKLAYAARMHEKKIKKNATIVRTKEIAVKPQIGDHDLKWRAKQAIDWINEGSIIKFKIKAFGQVGTRAELIEDTYTRFINLIGDHAQNKSPLKKLSPVLYEATISKK